MLYLLPKGEASIKSLWVRTEIRIEQIIEFLHTEKIINVDLPPDIPEIGVICKETQHLLPLHFSVSDANIKENFTLLMGKKNAGMGVSTIY